jgi:hypothetical protein
MEDEISLQLENTELLYLPERDGHGFMQHIMSHGSAEAGVALCLIRNTLSFLNHCIEGHDAVTMHIALPNRGTLQKEHVPIRCSVHTSVVRVVGNALGTLSLPCRFALKHYRSMTTSMVLLVRRFQRFRARLNGMQGILHRLDRGQQMSGQSEESSQ